jgi:hypothetical protein
MQIIWPKTHLSFVLERKSYLVENQPYRGSDKNIFFITSSIWRVLCCKSGNYVIC